MPSSGSGSIANPRVKLAGKQFANFLEHMLWRARMLLQNSASLGFTSTWLLPEIGPPHAIIQKYTVLVLNQGNTHLDVKNVVTMNYHDGFSNVRMYDIIHVENAKCKKLLFNRRCLSLSVFLCLYTSWYRRYRHSPTSEGWWLCHDDSSSNAEWFVSSPSRFGPLWLLWITARAESLTAIGLFRCFLQHSHPSV